MAYKGPDISSWQGDIDITALSSQVDFFIFRGYAGISKDSKVDRNVQLAIENNKPYGLYMYSYALNEAQATEEAQRLVGLANTYSVKPTFLCIDMEDADGYKKRYGMPSNDVLKAMCRVACEIFENAGYYANIYASTSWFNNQLSGNELNKYDKWVAHWPVSNGNQIGDNTPANWENANNCGIWQFTSEGTLNGYNGRLDMNYAYKDFVLGGNTPIPQPEPIPEPTPHPVDPDYTGKITYQAFVGKNWLPEVDRCDNTPDGYAGLGNKPITAFRCKPENGEIIYKAHLLKGNWLPEVNSKDYFANNGDSYAGLIGKSIDAIMIKSTKGYVDYRVKTAKRGWLPWVRQYDDYAGNFGEPIIGIQMK